VRVKTPENTNTNSLTITVNDTARNVAAHHDDVLQHPHGQTRLHSGADQVSDDPVSEHVPDRTEIEPALSALVLGDLGEPQLV